MLIDNANVHPQRKPLDNMNVCWIMVKLNLITIILRTGKMRRILIRFIFFRFYINLNYSMGITSFITIVLTLNNRQTNLVF